MTHQNITLHDVVRLELKSSRYLPEVNCSYTKIVITLKTGDSESKVELSMHHNGELDIEGAQS